MRQRVESMEWRRQPKPRVVDQPKKAFRIPVGWIEEIRVDPGVRCTHRLRRSLRVGVGNGFDRESHPRAPRVCRADFGSSSRSRRFENRTFSVMPRRSRWLAATFSGSPEWPPLHRERGSAGVPTGPERWPSTCPVRPKKTKKTGEKSVRTSQAERESRFFANAHKKPELRRVFYSFSLSVAGVSAEVSNWAGIINEKTDPSPGSLTN